MLFNLHGIRIDVALPKSLLEADARIEKLGVLHEKLVEELKELRPKSLPRQIKGQAIHEVDVELQILKHWRKNANIRLEKLLKITEVGSGELQTEAGLVKHLYQELRRSNREHRVSIERDSKLANVLAAAQLWLRNHYSTTLPSADLVKDMESNEDAHLQKRRIKLEKLERQFQERELNRWQEHLLTQQKQPDLAAAVASTTTSATRSTTRSATRSTTRSSTRSTARSSTNVITPPSPVVSLQQQQAEIRKARAERKRKQQEEALEMEHNKAETQAAMQLLSQLSQQNRQ